MNKGASRGHDETLRFLQMTSPARKVCWGHLVPVQCFTKTELQLIMPCVVLCCVCVCPKSLFSSLFPLLSPRVWFSNLTNLTVCVVTFIHCVRLVSAELLGSCFSRVGVCFESSNFLLLHLCLLKVEATTYTSNLDIGMFYSICFLVIQMNTGLRHFHSDFTFQTRSQHTFLQTIVHHKFANQCWFTGSCWVTGESYHFLSLSFLLLTLVSPVCRLNLNFSISSRKHDCSLRGPLSILLKMYVIYFDKGFVWIYSWNGS